MVVLVHAIQTCELMSSGIARAQLIPGNKAPKCGDSIASSLVTKSAQATKVIYETTKAIKTTKSTVKSTKAAAKSTKATEKATEKSTKSTKTFKSTTAIQETDLATESFKQDEAPEQSMAASEPTQVVEEQFNGKRVRRFKRE